LLAYPVREIFVRMARVRGFWAYYLPLDVMTSFSAAYELMEWGVAVVFGGETADTDLGTQGACGTLSRTWPWRHWRDALR